MSRRIVDATALPTIAFGTRAPIWWGTILLLAVELTTFALVLASFLYVRWNFAAWPPDPTPHPLPGTIALVPQVVSVAPMILAYRASNRCDLRGMRLHMAITTLLGFVFIATRVYEFAALPFRWDANAYASIVWVTLGLHTVDAVASVLENLFLTVVLLRPPVEEKRRLDVDAGAWAWIGVVAVWIPFYVLFYLQGKGP